MDMREECRNVSREHVFISGTLRVGFRNMENGGHERSSVFRFAEVFAAQLDCCFFA